MGIPRIIICGCGPHLRRLHDEPDAVQVSRLVDLEFILTDQDPFPPSPQVIATKHGWVFHNLANAPDALVNGVPVGMQPQALHPSDVVVCGPLALHIDGPIAPAPAPLLADTSLTIQAVAHRSWEEALTSLGNYGGSRQGQAGHLLTLFRAGFHLRHIGSLAEFLQSSLADAMTVLDAQRGCIVLADESAGCLGVPAACAARPGVSIATPYSKTLAQRAYERSESLLCQDKGMDEEVEVSHSIRLKSMASVICAVLRSPRQRLGVLHLDRGPLQEPFTEEEFFLADAIAASVSAGIESAQLIAGQRDLFLQTVNTLARAVELRDQYTGNHTLRVTDYALLLAEGLGLSVGEREQVRVGTPLHDIGKIGISDGILQKPGKLTAEEFEEIKTHTVKGAAMVEGIPGLRPIIPIIRHHHERWDGLGYPDRLSGEGISLLARIVAVADAFDAMTSARPYRPALPVEQAFEEIAVKAGTHFAPECARAFLGLRERIAAQLQ